MFDLQNTVSVVIGGNGVLGRAMSSALAEAGSEAAVVGRDMEKARFAAHRIRVNAIIPGFFPAEQNRSILSSDRIESIMRHTPIT